MHFCAIIVYTSKIKFDLSAEIDGDETGINLFSP